MSDVSRFRLQALQVSKRFVVASRLWARRFLRPLSERVHRAVMELNKVTSLERFQIVVGIVVSVATLAIGWKTFELNALTERNNEQLTQIKDKLSEDTFAFERLREIYDRTEKYLSSNDQGEKRGKALTVLIKSIPDPTCRQDLLSLVVTESKSVVVAAAAANVQSPIDISARAPTIDVARPGTSGFIAEFLRSNWTTMGTR